MMTLLRSLVFSAGYTVLTLITSTLVFTTIWFLPARMRFFYYGTWCRAVIGWAAIVCGVRYRIIGRENIPDYPVVVLSNHQSTWETFFLYQAFEPAVPILKKELLKIPFFGWALRLQKPIAIDRSKPREATKSMLSQGSKRLLNGMSVIVFPEGTRSPAGMLGRFSRGGAQLATATSTPVVPVIHNAGNCWPSGQWHKRPGEITVVIGKPVISEGKSAHQLLDEFNDWVDEQAPALGLQRKQPVINDG